MAITATGTPSGEDFWVRGFRERRERRETDRHADRQTDKRTGIAKEGVERKERARPSRRERKNIGRRAQDLTLSYRNTIFNSCRQLARAHLIKVHADGRIAVEFHAMPVVKPATGIHTAPKHAPHDIVLARVTALPAPVIKQRTKSAKNESKKRYISVFVYSTVRSFDRCHRIRRTGAGRQCGMVQL